MRDKQSVFAVLAVIVVVVGFAVLSNVVGNRGSGDNAPAAADTAATGGGATAAPTTSAAKPVSLPGCTTPPAINPNPPKPKAAPDPKTAAGKTVDGTITTNCGPIGVQLDGTKAPAATASFMLLAQTGYWKDSKCHRLTGDEQGLWVLQCGDPTGTGSGPGPGYHFGVENAPADTDYPAGTLALARPKDQAKNSDQFFIVYKDTKLPNDAAGGYTVFGHVTSGMDIVSKVAAAGIDPQDGQSPLAPISLLNVTTSVK